MAVKAFNSIAGFSTGDPSVIVIQVNADIKCRYNYRKPYCQWSFKSRCSIESYINWRYR